MRDDTLQSNLDICRELGFDFHKIAKIIGIPYDKLIRMKYTPKLMKKVNNAILEIMKRRDK